MSKTWQTRLNDTIRKVRDDQGDAVGDILQGLVDGLPDDAKERISRDLSLGWRIWWNRGARETENRRVRRANALTDRLVGDLPPLATAVGEAVRQIPLNSVKELELRLLAPAQFFMGFIGSGAEERTTQSQYDWALANTWANSCGGFSAVLKDAISAHWDTVLDTMDAGEPQRDSAYITNQLAATLNDVQNKYLRITLGCHSFIVENLGSVCRIYQVYMAVEYDGYNFADDLAHPTVLPRARFIEHIRAVLTDPAAANQADGAAVALFKGSCWPGNNARAPQTVCITMERTTQPRTVAQMATEFANQVTLQDGAWQQALTFATVAAYNATN